MGKPGTREIAELAALVRELTAEVPAARLVHRFDTGRALWDRYRSGAAIVPWHLLEQLVTDRIPDKWERLIALSQAKELYDRAESSAARREVNHVRLRPHVSKRKWWVAAVAVAVVALVATTVWLPKAAQPPAAAEPPAELYAISTDMKSVLRWDDRNSRWITIGGPAQDLLVSKAGVFITDPGNGRIMRYDGRPHAWTLVGERAAAIAVTDNRLYRLSPDKDIIWEWQPETLAWTIIGGPASTLFAGGAGLFAVDPTGKLIHYDGKPGSWTKVTDACSAEDQFVVGHDALYARSHKDGTVWEWSGGWTRIGGPARVLRAGGAGLLMQDAETGKILRYTGRPFTWSIVGDSVADLAVSGDTVYTLSPNRRYVIRWRNDPLPPAKVVMDAPAARIVVDSVG